MGIIHENPLPDPIKINPDPAPAVTLIEARPDCTLSGMEVWVEEDPTPIFLMGVKSPDDVDMGFVAQVVADRQTAQAKAAVIAAVQAAAQADMDAQVAAASDLYDSDGPDAVTSALQAQLDYLTAAGIATPADLVQQCIAAEVDITATISTAMSAKQSKVNG